MNLTLKIEEDFFKNTVEQDEIEGGTLQVHLRAWHSAGDCFTFHYKGEGTIIVPCDRCLDSTEVYINFDEIVKVAYEDESQQSDDNLILIPFSQANYDIAWDLYEAIALNCPIQRVHPDGFCNADMLARFSTEEEDDTEEAYDS